MKWISLALFALMAGAAVAQGATPTDSPVVGRYQLGGTQRDVLILIDTATGRTWKYRRDVRDADREPAWIPLRFPDTAAPAAAGALAPPPQAPAEQPRITPGPYKDRRPGGK